jgi:hypothetical protein
VRLRLRESPRIPIRAAPIARDYPKAASINARVCFRGMCDGLLQSRMSGQTQVVVRRKRNAAGILQVTKLIVIAQGRKLSGHSFKHDALAGDRDPEEEVRPRHAKDSV